MDLAATVTLGSTLHARASQVPRPSQVVAPTGCAAIDRSALGGGFRYGEITTIAGAHGAGKTLLTYHTIYGQLRSHDSAEAVVVDTNGSFEAARLRDVFAWRLQRDVGRDQAAEAADAARLDVNAKAVAMLDRVKFTRVFDVVGIAQAVQEVADGWEERDRAFEALRAGEKKRRAAEIPSSQDEEMDEMDAALLASQPYEAPPDAGSGGTGMIVVDNVASHFSSEMSKNPVQGQALLTPLLRSLQHLTRERRICTILVNNAIGATGSADAQHQRRIEDGASIFASVLGKPALGRMLAYLVDQSIFVSRVPKTREDVGKAHENHPAHRGTSHYAGTLEVLKDRHGTQEGMWAAFEIFNGVVLRSIGPE